MNLFDTLVNPAADDCPERSLVAHAANLLQIGEFQILQLAFAEAFAREMREGEGNALFRSFMMFNEVPPWVLSYARRIVALDDARVLDDADPAYHRYDVDDGKRLPDGLARFLVAVTVIAGTLGGGLAMASYAAKCTNSILPPCFDERADDLPAAGRVDPLPRD